MSDTKRDDRTDAELVRENICYVPWDDGGVVPDDDALVARVRAAFDRIIAALAESRAEVAALLVPFRNAQDTVDELMRLRAEVAALRDAVAGAIAWDDNDVSDNNDYGDAVFARLRAALAPKGADTHE